MSLSASERSDRVCGRIQLGLLAWALLWPALAPAAQTVQGTVTRVVDGDTVWVEDAHGTKLPIRLVSIDAPEVGHPRPGRTAPGTRWRSASSWNMPVGRHTCAAGPAPSGAGGWSAPAGRPSRRPSGTAT